MISSTASGFPGLLAETISMGQNDVIGSTSANILCTSCPTPTYEDQDKDGDIDDEDIQTMNRAEITCTTKNCQVEGSVFLGPITIPNSESFPSPPLSAISYDIDLKDGDVEIETENDDAKQNGVATFTSMCDMEGTAGDSTTHAKSERNRNERIQLQYQEHQTPKDCIIFHGKYYVDWQKSNHSYRSICWACREYLSQQTAAVTQTVTLWVDQQGEMYSFISLRKCGNRWWIRRRGYHWSSLG